LRELVGMDVAKRLTMTGELFDGRKAAELGLVTEVSEDPLHEAEMLAKELATKSPDAVAYTKKLFHRTAHLSPRRALRIESRLQLRLLRGVNHKIARTAGMAKQVEQYVRRELGDEQSRVAGRAQSGSTVICPRATPHSASNTGSCWPTRSGLPAGGRRRRWPPRRRTV